MNVDGNRVALVQRPPSSAPMSPTPSAWAAAAASARSARSTPRRRASVAQTSRPSDRRSAPAQAVAAPSLPPAPAAAGASRWLGPIAGLAAGLGLAALLSHFGLVRRLRELPADRAARRRRRRSCVRMFLARRAPSPHAAAVRRRARCRRRRASSRTPTRRRRPPTRFEPVMGGAAAAATAPRPAGCPPGFDAGAVRRAGEAAVPQAAGRLRRRRPRGAGRRDDAGDVRRDRGRPRRSAARTCRPRSCALDAEVLEVATEGDSHWASVRFTGLLREDGAVLPKAFDEVWNLVEAGRRLVGLAARGHPAARRCMKWPDPGAAPARTRQPHARRSRPGRARSSRRSPGRVFIAGASARCAARGRIARRRHARAARRPARAADLDADALAAGRCRRSSPTPRAGTNSSREEGDAELGGALKDLARTLPWFVEETFAKALGPVVGQRVADAGRRLLAFPEYAAQRVAESVAQLRARRGAAARASPPRCATLQRRRGASVAARRRIDGSERSFDVPGRGGNRGRARRRGAAHAGRERRGCGTRVTPSRVVRPRCTATRRDRVVRRRGARPGRMPVHGMRLPASPGSSWSRCDLGLDDFVLGHERVRRTAAVRPPRAVLARPVAAARRAAARGARGARSDLRQVRADAVDAPRPAAARHRRRARASCRTACRRSRRPGRGDARARLRQAGRPRCSSRSTARRSRARRSRRSISPSCPTARRSRSRCCGRTSHDVIEHDLALMQTAADAGRAAVAPTASGCGRATSSPSSRRRSATSST